jgi:uncharacterized protein
VIDNTAVIPDTAVGATQRTTIRRLPDKAVTDRATLHTILDRGLVAHIGLITEKADGASGQPVVLPIGYARDGDRVLIHGSSASRLFRALAAGEPACLTVTILDGLVYARSAFESSMNYRCAMVFGRCAPLNGSDKLAGLRRLSDHLLPNRWDDVRQPTRKELAATLVLAMPLAESSVKVSAGPPDDEPEDLTLSTWAGVLPLTITAGNPKTAPDLMEPHPVPTYVTDWNQRRREHTE